MSNIYILFDVIPCYHFWRLKYDTVQYLCMAVGFPSSGIGLYTCTHKVKNSNVHKEKQYRSHNAQIRKQNISNNVTKIQQITS
jgi:hypothetical protein